MGCPTIPPPPKTGIPELDEILMQRHLRYLQQRYRREQKAMPFYFFWWGIVFAMIALLFVSVARGDERCDASQWAHTYHQQRFTIISTCRCTTGYPVTFLKEKDGDDHIRFRPDERGLLNHANMTKQHGLLVVEPVCEHKVTQRDAIAACKGATPVWVPSGGQHVRVCGVYARDDEHGWLEFHAVTFQELP